MKVSLLKDRLSAESGTAALARLYGNDLVKLERQAARCSSLLDTFARRFGDGGDPDAALFSAPGRTEIGGNHTDHNRGRVLAAAIDLDTLAVAGPTDGGHVTIVSEGYDEPFVVDVGDLAFREEEEGTTRALIRGVAAGLFERGCRIGGFRACVASDVAVGSGLSSSAAFEVLVGTVFNHLYNDGRIDPRAIAMAGRQAENDYFGKPSGLMDQMAGAVGGFVTIDFDDPAAPLVERVDVDFASAGLSLVVTDTGGSHADLRREYAAVQREMQAVARALGGELLRDVSVVALLEQAAELRGEVGDRAILRAFHFFADHDRVAEQVAALRDGNFPYFLSLVNQSGRSSWMLLQNGYVPGSTQQGVTLGLALSEIELSGHGAWRVHGGGFAGTILAFVPDGLLKKYVGRMETVFGEGAARVLSIRGPGAGRVEIG